MSAIGHGGWLLQVHLAKLGGQQVVVKVQRPGLRQLFDIDLKNIRVLAQWLQAVDPKSDGAARDWVAIYDECSRILYQARLTLISFESPGAGSQQTTVFVLPLRTSNTGVPDATRRQLAASTNAREDPLVYAAHFWHHLK